MKTITIDEYETRIPNSNDKYFNGLSEQEKLEYLELYSTYSNLLVDYLIKNCRLKEYDEAICDDSCTFQKVSEENMDIYQFLTSDKLNYIYVRNNLFIERLTQDEWKYLLSRVNKNEDFNQDDSEFIKNTFKRVIAESTDSIYNTLFGPDNSSFIAPSNSLILGIRFDDFYSSNNESPDKWSNDNRNRLQIINIISMMLHSNLSKELDMPVTVIKYNDFSINKKDNKSVNNNIVM